MAVALAVTNATGLWGQLWNWLGPTLVALASIVAIVVFIQAGLALRRRPEIGFGWSTSTDGVTYTDTDWSFNIGEQVWVRITSTNIGDASSSQSIWNFVVPAGLSIDQVYPPVPSSFSGVENRRVGGSAQFFKDERQWTVGLTWIHTYRLKLPSDPGRVPLVAEMYDTRFNDKGMRCLPSYRRGHGEGFGRVKVRPDDVEAKLGFRTHQKTIVVSRTPVIIKAAKIAIAMTVLRWALRQSSTEPRQS